MQAILGTRGGKGEGWGGEGRGGKGIAIVNRIHRRDAISLKIRVICLRFLRVFITNLVTVSCAVSFPGHVRNWRGLGMRQEPVWLGNETGTGMAWE